MKIEPCPFCGSENTELRRLWQGDFRVSCIRCDAAGAWRRDKIDAIANWNRVSLAVQRAKETEDDLK